METPIAESTASADVAKVDSAATAPEVDGSAPSATDTGEAVVATSSEAKRSAGDERFEKLTRERYEDRAARELAEYRAEQAEKRLAALETEAKAKREPVAPDTPPTLDSVGYDEAKYAAALQAHFLKQATAEARKAAEETLSERDREVSERQLRSTWSKRETDFIKSQPDYVDKVQNARTLPISQEMQATLMELDDGPQLAYYLVENREKAAMIMQLPLPAQMRELGRIQGVMEAKKAQPKPSVSQAPSPVPKVDGVTDTQHTRVDDPSSDDLSDSEWTRRRNLQLAKRKKG